VIKPFATAEHEVTMDGIHHPLPYKGSFSSIRTMSTSQWPDARDHPFFYVGVYAAIGLTAVLAGNASMMAQYTGALRASRLLFKELLTTVIHATMRWYDVTPHG
jgi:hypothetical protein